MRPSLTKITRLWPSPVVRATSATFQPGSEDASPILGLDVLELNKNREHERYRILPGHVVKALIYTAVLHTDTPLTNSEGEMVVAGKLPDMTPRWLPTSSILPIGRQRGRQCAHLRHRDTAGRGVARENPGL